MKTVKVVWASFDPPEQQEEINLRKKGWTPVWMDEDTAYMLRDKVNRFDMEPSEITRNLREFAKRNNARLVVGSWSGNMHNYIKASKYRDMPCYNSVWSTVGSSKRNSFKLLGYI